MSLSILNNFIVRLFLKLFVCFLNCSFTSSHSLPFITVAFELALVELVE